MGARESFFFKRSKKEKRKKKGGGGWLDKERNIFEENMPTHQSQVVGFSTLSTHLRVEIWGFFSLFSFSKKN